MRAFSIFRHRQLPRRPWMAFSFLAMVLLASLQPPMSVQADAGYAYYWSLTFDFEGSSEGKLYVAVGHNDNGDVQDPPLHAETFSVPCTRVGNASVTNGVLKLNGGYLRCDLDLGTALEDTIADCKAIKEGCYINIQDTEHYANFRAWAKVMSASPGEAPIFFHEDASYSIDPKTSMTQIKASLTPHGAIPSTSLVSFPVLNDWQSYSAEYLCDPSCEMYYGVTGAAEVVVTANDDVQFSTQPTSVFLGHNPVTGMTAPAGTILETIFVDPPNYGNN